MEEILSIASSWLFSENGRTLGFGFFMLGFFALVWVALKLSDMIESYEFMAKSSLYWDIDRHPNAIPDNKPAPVRKNFLNYTPGPTVRPKYPPKAVFFAREDGETRVVEGHQEPNYLTYWQKRDWEDWEKYHVKQKTSKTTK